MSTFSGLVIDRHRVDSVVVVRLAVVALARTIVVVVVIAAAMLAVALFVVVVAVVAVDVVRLAHTSQRCWRAVVDSRVITWFITLMEGFH